jgi:hypothetical protein
MFPHLHDPTIILEESNMSDTKDDVSTWEYIKPRLMDAGVIAGGTAVGTATGALAMQALQGSRVGNWWKSLPPEAKAKMLIPTALVGAGGGAALMALRDKYRYSEDLDRPKTAEMVEPSPHGGHYMAVSNLKSLRRNSSELLGMVSADSPLPDWVEAKLTQSASSIDDVADWMRNGGEANKTAARQLRNLARFC